MAYFVYSFIIFILGLIVGSFLNVVIYRLENGEKIINDRSKCLHCKRVLAWYDLIPVLSFIFLKGKCRYCNKKISWQYPLVEIGTGILFVMILNYVLCITNYEYLISNFQFFNTIHYSLFTIQFLFLLFWFYIISSLIIIFVYDLKHYIIPDKVIYPAIIIAIGFNLSNNLVTLNHLFAAFIAGLFFLSIVIITKGKGMGGGDIKLVFLMGLILGWPVIIFSVFLASVLGSIVGIYLILIGKKKMKSMVPFGPFLVAGTFIGMFFGEEIIEWYLNLVILF